MKIIKLMSACCLLVTFTACTPKKVYIRTGSQAEVYHKKENCRGLSRCSDEIIPITVSEAEKMGRRPCKICME